MKLALHRSITFWSGLVVMGMICWAWRDSSRVHSTASAYGWTLLHTGSALSITHVSGTANNDPWARRSPVDSLTAPWDGAFLAKPIFVRARAKEDPELRSRFFAAIGPRRYVPRRPEAVHLYFIARGSNSESAILIPHWLMLLVASLAWVGLLFWRKRRRAAAGNRMAV